MSTQCNDELQNLINIFRSVCEEYKHNVNSNSLKNPEYIITTKINLNYKLIENFYEAVVYIESTELVTRLYTNIYYNNYSISIIPFDINETELFSEIKILDQMQNVVHDEKFIYYP